METYDHTPQSLDSIMNAKIGETIFIPYRIGEGPTNLTSRLRARLHYHYPGTKIKTKMSVGGILVTKTHQELSAFDVRMLNASKT